MNEAPYYQPGSLVKVWGLQAKKEPSIMKVIACYKIGIEVVFEDNKEGNPIFVPYTFVQLIERLGTE